MTTRTETLSLRDIAAKLSPDYESPADLADAVLNEIGASPARLRAALAVTLPNYLSCYVSRTRNAVISGRSAKVSSVRAWFPQFLAQQLFTEAGWRRLGDCGRDDLLFAAARRRESAAAELVRADQFERLASLVGAGTVSDLDESTVRDALDGAQ